MKIYYITSNKQLVTKPGYTELICPLKDIYI